MKNNNTLLNLRKAAKERAIKELKDEFLQSENFAALEKLKVHEKELNEQTNENENQNNY